MAVTTTLQRRIRSVRKRNEAVRLSLEEKLSNEEIAQRLGVKPRMVRNYLSAEYKAECLFPSGLTAADVDIMRKHCLDDIESVKVVLREKLAHFRTLKPMHRDEGEYVMEAIFGISQEMTRNTSETSKLYGLYAVPPKAETSSTTNVTNNTVIMDLDSDVIEQIKARRKARELEAVTVETSAS